MLKLVVTVMATLPVRSAPARSLELIDSAARAMDIDRARRVYVNRNLRLDQIELVGFDMDYTLALYNQPRIEDLSIRATLLKLVSGKGYTSDIRELQCDAALALRGIVVDRVHGNIFKPDRYGYTTRALHGRLPIDKAKLSELYHRDRMRLSNRRYAWIDSLFALPEAVIYASLVTYFDRAPPDVPRPPYAQLWEDIRECIDMAHRDGSIKTVVSADLPGFIERDPALAETLHKLRSSGKRLFLLTNSAWDYTNPVMSYLLDGVLSAYPSWRNYFDIVVVSAGKPEFFTEERSFVDLDAEGLPLVKSSDGPFGRGRIYSAGNIKEFQARTRTSGDKVLFVGDHIYGDMLRSRKSSSWRTAMVLQELEHEIENHDRMAAQLGRLDGLDHQLTHLDSELNERQTVMRSLQRLSTEELDGTGEAYRNAAKRKVKEDIDRLRVELRETISRHKALESEIDAAFNPHWGPLFREGYEISKFGEQVEAYACVYTSRVSNFRFYSPMQYFRGPRDRMPHER